VNSNVLVGKDNSYLPGNFDPVEILSNPFSYGLD